jgi:hypothetical protein
MIGIEQPSIDSGLAIASASRGWADLRNVSILHERSREPLRDGAFHRPSIDGGYAQPTVADERHCFRSSRYADGRLRRCCVLV